MAYGEMEITVTCFRDGKTKVEVSGAEGNACLKETEDLEEALGKVVKRTLKPEAHKEQKAGAGTVKVGS